MPLPLVIELQCCNQSRDDKRVDLSEFKKALPLLVRWAQLELAWLHSDACGMSCLQAFHKTILHPT